MSIIQDKLGNEFLRNGGMDPNFPHSMIMFSHLPPVTSFTRLTSQTSMADLPQEMILKKERDSPDHGGGFLHSMGIKQEKLSELDYRLPMYATGTGTAGGKSTDMLDMSLGNHQNMLLHDLSLSNVSLDDKLGVIDKLCLDTVPTFFVFLFYAIFRCFISSSLEDWGKTQKNLGLEEGGEQMEKDQMEKPEGNKEILQRYVYVFFF